MVRFLGPITILFLVVVTFPCSGEIHADSVLTATGTWIFSQFNCGCPPCETSCSFLTPVDARLFLILDPPLGMALITDWGGQALGDVPLHSVLYAPTSGYTNGISADTSEEITVGHTYVIRTMDGGHALLSPLTLALDGMTFVYKYQDDGSGIFFDESTPVLRSTWGRIKALYNH